MLSSLCEKAFSGLFENFLTISMNLYFSVKVAIKNPKPLIFPIVFL